MEKRPRIKKMVPVTQHQTLPFIATVALNLVKDKEMRAAYIYALRLKGWKLQAIADALGLTRERIRQIETKASPALVIHVLADPGSFPVPELETREIEVPAEAEYVEPSDETLARLIELRPLAQQVRYNHTQYRAEAEEYSALVWHAHSVEGVTLYRLAKRLGVTHGALRFRLARYGYIIPKTGKSKCYQPVKQTNRAVTQ
jgi:transcriptional regulator with XRE-family HTH domain